VVAAALQSNHRASVVGLRSYGVGSVQRLIPLDDGAALILTVAKYYSPAGKALQDNGVTPDVEAQPSEGQVLAPVPHAPPRPDDPVLEKGLEVLRTQAEAEPARKAA
jgi:carboxyl-terminal processing protease